MRPIVIFLIRKAFFYVFVFFIMLLITFILPRMIPGNALLLTLHKVMATSPNPHAIEAKYRHLIEYFGLNKPLWEQFIDYLVDVFRGDLGYSMMFPSKKVADLLFSRIPWSLFLLIPANVAAWFVGNTIGVYAAKKRGSIIDNVLTIISLILCRTPFFILGLILLIVFAYYLDIFPLGGGWDPGLQPSLTWEFIKSYLWHYILPFMSIFITGIGIWLIGARAVAIYEYGSDYIEYLDTLGVPDKKLSKYVFRNIMLIQVTGFTLGLGWAVGGSLLTEVVFSYPGVGYLLYLGGIRLDYMLIQGSFLVVAASVLAANYITDLIYAFIDPRVRKGYASM